MSVRLLTEHHLEILSLKGGCTGSYESTLVKMPHCWKSHVAAHICSAVAGYYAVPVVLLFDGGHICDLNSLHIMGITVPK